MITFGEYSFVVATRPELLRETERLRRVWFKEGNGGVPFGGARGFETASDPHDEYTLTAAALLSDGRVVGTARLILNSPVGLPAARVADFSLPPGAGRFKPAELTGLAIDPSHRGGVDDVIETNRSGIAPAASLPRGGGDGVAVTRGLLMALSEASAHLGVTHWCLLARRPLWHLLRTLQIPFVPIAPETDCWGQQTPYRVSAAEVETGLSRPPSDQGAAESASAAPASADGGEGESQIFRAGGFRFFVVRTSALLDAVYRLRYRVFVEENDCDPPELYPDKRLHDRYDAASFVVAAVDSRGGLVGTLRLIQNSPEGLPCLNWADPRYPEKMTLSRRVGEISRLALSREHSRYIGDVFYSLLSTERKAKVDFRWLENPGMIHRERRKALFILYGMFRVAYDIARWLRLTILHLVADGRLRRLLESRGMPLVPIGPRLKTGPRGGAPHAIKFQDIESAVRSMGGVRELARAMVRFVPPALPPEHADVRVIE